MIYEVGCFCGIIDAKGWLRADDIEVWLGVREERGRIEFPMLLTMTSCALDSATSASLK